MAIHRLVVAALSVCPAMFRFWEPRRPQHGVWQFIVGTLVAVLALPAAICSTYSPREPFRIFTLLGRVSLAHFGA